MPTYTKDTIPWRLRNASAPRSGALTAEQIETLSRLHGPEESAVDDLSKALDMALSEELHVRQLELHPIETKKSVLNHPPPAETERFSEIFCGFELQDLVGFLQKPCKFWCCHEAEETHARAR